MVFLFLFNMFFNFQGQFNSQHDLCDVDLKLLLKTLLLFTIILFLSKIVHTAALPISAICNRSAAQSSIFNGIIGVASKYQSEYLVSMVILSGWNTGYTPFFLFICKHFLCFPVTQSICYRDHSVVLAIVVLEYFIYFYTCVIFMKHIEHVSMVISYLME